MKKNSFLYKCIPVAGIIFLIACLPLFAQEAERKAPVFNVDAQRIVQLALLNSLDIQIARFDTLIKKTELDSVQSLFDTFLNANIEYTNDEKDTPTTFSGTKNTSQMYSFSVDKKLPSGTKVDIEASNERTHTNSLFTTVNPAHEATMQLTLTQELGKNFFGLADRSGVQLTKIDIENTEYTSLSDIEDALAKVLVSYWNLVLKKETLDIRREMREQADRLYKIYQEKFELGMVETVDIAQIRAHMKRLDTGVLNAELEEETAKNDLLFLINVEDLNVILSTQDILTFDTSFVDLYEKVTRAVHSRRDYQKIKNELKKYDIDLIVKQNALWPQIDLEASYTKNGINDVSRSAWGETTNRDQDELFLGLTIRLSLENNEARSQLEATQLKKEQLLLMLKRVERTILREINNQVMTVNTLKNKVDLTRELVEFEEEKLQAEHKRLGWGRSNADVMVRYEDDVLTARLDYATALYRYRIESIELERLQNVLLNRYWIQ